MTNMRHVTIFLCLFSLQERTRLMHSKHSTAPKLLWLRSGRWCGPWRETTERKWKKRRANSSNSSRMVGVSFVRRSLCVTTSLFPTLFLCRSYICSDQSKVRVTEEIVFPSESSRQRGAPDANWSSQCKRTDSSRNFCLDVCCIKRGVSLQLFVMLDWWQNVGLISEKNIHLYVFVFAHKNLS